MGTSPLLFYASQASLLLSDIVSDGESCSLALLDVYHSPAYMAASWTILEVVAISEKYIPRV